MATSYSNFGGSGFRFGYFLIKSDLPWSQSLNRLFDGSRTSNANFLGSTTAVAGKSFVDLNIYGSPRIIDAFTIYHGSISSPPTLKFQGWNGSSWIDLVSFTLNTSTSTSQSFANTTAYTRYRFVGVSGNLGTSLFYQIEFSTQAASSYETGNRAALITSATTLTNGSTTVPQNLLDGSKDGNNTNAWYPNGGQAVSGKTITFTLGAAQQFTSARISSISSSSGDNGTWKWQGSNDGSSWNDLTDPFVWYWGTYNQLDEDVIAPLFKSSAVASFLYYRLLGVSGTTSSSPWYTEVEFDAGPYPTAPSHANVSQVSHQALTSGAGSAVRVSQLLPKVLSQGPGSIAKINQVAVSVLLSLSPAGELKGDTNAGIHDDITEFGGTAPIEPIELSISFLDEGQFNVDINTNVSNPYKVRFNDDTQFNVKITIPIMLSVSFLDESTFDAYSDALTHVPVIQTNVIATGR